MSLEALDEGWMTWNANSTSSKTESTNEDKLQQKYHLGRINLKHFLLGMFRLELSSHLNIG